MRTGIVVREHRDMWHSEYLGDYSILHQSFFIVYISTRLLSRVVDIRMLVRSIFRSKI